MLLIWLIFQDNQASMTEMSRNSRRVTIKLAIMQVRLNKNYFVEKKIGWDEIWGKPVLFNNNFFYSFSKFSKSYFTIWIKIKFILDGFIFPSIQTLYHQQVYNALNDKIKDWYAIRINGYNIYGLNDLATEQG